MRRRCDPTKEARIKMAKIPKPENIACFPKKEEYSEEETAACSTYDANKGPFRERISLNPIEITDSRINGLQGLGKARVAF
jgi:hypothetical protein